MTNDSSTAHPTPLRTGFRVQVCGNKICIPDLIRVIFKSQFKSAIMMSHLLFPEFVQETLPFRTLIPNLPDPNQKKLMAVADIKSAVSLMRQLPRAHEYEESMLATERILNDFVRDRARKRPYMATEYLESTKQSRH